jgi:D-alanyl-lipoteichoic acid acyltransferase DltB (MBOAT superfamily)
MKNLFTFDANTPLLFTHYYFWVFFTAVLAGLVLLKSKTAWRNAFLCFASLFFYFKTSGLFVLILFFTTIFNFYQAKLIHRVASGKWRKINLCMGLAVNLFFLCYFKYAYFVTDVLNKLFGTHLRIFDSFAWFGNVLAGTQRFDVSVILLPVGISFFTFQNISYIVDVFRKRVEPVKKIWDFGFYVTFFPGLVAGPIVRANEFVPQIYKPFFLGQKQFGIAVFWILNGLTKKIVLSDYIAVNFVDRIFENPTMFTGFENLTALFAYSLQVYADFSGYTDIAIGVAMLMGFYLPKNFNSPYKATSPGDFWKRWHISLSTWLKDYLYISIGGNRNATFASYAIIIIIGIIAAILSGNVWIGAIICMAAGSIAYLAYAFPKTRQKINTNINLMNTMLIGGLWHGASWNFVIWGGLNGIGIVFHKFWKTFAHRLQLYILLMAAGLFVTLGLLFSLPVVNIAAVWLSVILAGTLIRRSYSYLAEKNIIPLKHSFRFLATAWAVLQTFVFISFTRLFFRAGSNLNPEEANNAAWNTAKNMLNRIGSSWNTSQIGSITYEYRYLFLLFAAGMIIHWLPEKLKRRYRLMFAKMPLVVMAAFTVVIIFIIYQFVTADLQAFIYFQF